MNGKHPLPHERTITEPVTNPVQTFRFLLLTAALLLVPVVSSHGALQKDPGPIPPLRPPKGKIALDIPERTILRGSLGFALLVLIAGRVLQLRKPKVIPPALPAIVQARLAFEVTRGGDIAAASQVVRRYLMDTFPIGDEGSTADELSERFAQQPSASFASAQSVRDFLVGVEHARFAPTFAGEFAEGCVERARTLVEEIEVARTSPPIAHIPAPPPLPPPPPVETVPPPLPPPPA